MNFTFDLLTLALLIIVPGIIGFAFALILAYIAIPDALMFVAALFGGHELLEINYGTGERYYAPPKKDKWGNMFYNVGGIETFIDTEKFDTAPVTHWGGLRLKRYFSASATPITNMDEAAITQVLDIAKETKNAKDSKLYEYPNIRSLKDFEITNLATCKIAMLKELVPKYSTVPNEKLDDKGDLKHIDEAELATQKALKQLEVGKEVARLRMQLHNEVLTPRYMLAPIAENATQKPITPTVLRDTKQNLKEGIINKQEHIKELFQYVTLAMIPLAGMVIGAILIYIFIWHK